MTGVQTCALPISHADRTCLRCAALQRAGHDTRQTLRQLCRRAGYTVRSDSADLCTFRTSGRDKRHLRPQDVNHAVGLELACKRGDKVNKGDTICIVYHDEELKPQCVEELYHAFELTNEEVAPQPIIEKVLS